MIFLVYGLFAYELVSGRHRAARQLAEELFALANASGEAAHLIGGQAIAIAALHQGHFATARSEFEHALSYGKDIEAAPPEAWLAQHPVVVCLSFVAWTVWHSGTERG